MSLKKTLGTITVGVILYISVYAVHKDITLAVNILTQDMLLALGLFGIKSYFGVQAQKLNGAKNDNM
jgi:hypothetical protein